MSYVVTLRDFLPIPRYDNKPWTKVLIEEGPTEDGPWTILGNPALSPVDADPTNPQVRAFTVENATLLEGWYRVTFQDLDNDQQLPVAPVKHIPEETLPYQPLLSDVGATLRTRTKDNNGNELGTFTANTRPTAEQAQRMIQQATDDITAGLDTDIPETAWRYIKEAIRIRAAMMIELSFFSDQVNTNRSVYPQLKEELEYWMPMVAKAIVREEEEAISGERGLATSPSFSFPQADSWLDRPM
jgi:hypothetical protein